MIFTQSLQKIDPSKPQEAIKKLYNHIKYIQEQLEYTLLNLDSRNITEIDLSQTTIGDSTGETSIGSYIDFTGNNGERFTAGKNSSGNFVFSIKGKKGELFLNSSGELVITESANLTIDGGEW